MRVGSSGDARLAGVVIDKCEATSLPPRPAQKRNYDARVQHCSDKYAREEGTIAISEARCARRRVAVAFAKNAAAAALVKTTPLPPVRASFDCRKAQSPLELLICADEDLAGADIDLAEAYKKAFKEAAPISARP